MLLDSENGESFILGVNLAKSILGWTGLDILEYKNTKTLEEMRENQKTRNL